MTLEIGFESLAAIIANLANGQIAPTTERVQALMEEVETADRVGLNVFVSAKVKSVGWQDMHRKRSGWVSMRWASWATPTNAQGTRSY